MFRILALSLLLSSSAFAQNKLILYGQGNFANQHIMAPEFSSNDVFAMNFKSGYGGGIRYDIEINPIVSLSYRLNYSQKGFNKRSNNFHYLGLDHSLVVTPPLWNNKVFYLLGGIRNDRLLTAKVTEPYMNSENNTPISLGDFDNWSFGALGALGYHVDRLCLEIGYNFDINSSLQTSTAKVKNNLWFLNVGFRVI